MMRTWFGRPVAVLAAALLVAAGLRADDGMIVAPPTRSFAPAPAFSATPQAQPIAAPRPMPVAATPTSMQRMPSVAVSPYNAPVTGVPTVSSAPLPVPAQLAPGSGAVSSSPISSSQGMQTWSGGAEMPRSQPVRDFFRRMWWGGSSGGEVIMPQPYTPTGRIMPIPATTAPSVAPAGHTR